MNADLAKRVKILGFQIVAETVKNETQDTFEDAKDEKMDHN